MARAFPADKSWLIRLSGKFMLTVTNCRLDIAEVSCAPRQTIKDTCGRRFIIFNGKPLFKRGHGSHRQILPTTVALRRNCRLFPSADVGSGNLWADKRCGRSGRAKCARSLGICASIHSGSESAATTAGCPAGRSFRRSARTVSDYRSCRKSSSSGQFCASGSARDWPGLFTVAARQPSSGRHNAACKRRFCNTVRAGCRATRDFRLINKCSDSSLPSDFVGRSRTVAAQQRLHTAANPPAASGFRTARCAATCATSCIGIQIFDSATHSYLSSGLCNSRSRKHHYGTRTEANPAACGIRHSAADWSKRCAPAIRGQHPCSCDDSTSGAEPTCSEQLRYRRTPVGFQQQPESQSRWLESAECRPTAICLTATRGQRFPCPIRKSQRAGSCLSRRSDAAGTT